jgi:hypothetical protein
MIQRLEGTSHQKGGGVLAAAVMWIPTWKMALRWPEWFVASERRVERDLSSCARVGKNLKKTTLTSFKRGGNDVSMGPGRLWQHEPRAGQVLAPAVGAGGGQWCCSGCGMAMGGWQGGAQAGMGLPYGPGARRTVPLSI